MTRKHYFFKLGKGNYIFNFLKKKNQDNDLHLIIGHGSWKVSDYEKDKLTSYIKDNPKGSGVQKVLDQITTFFESTADAQNSYFWIFDETKIYALQACNSKVHDLCDLIDKAFLDHCVVVMCESTSEEQFRRIGAKTISNKDYNGEPLTKDKDKFYLWGDAKLCKAKIVFEFEACKVIHKFASTNANQAYNRRTIAEIKDKDNLKEIADAILDYQLYKKCLPNPKPSKELSEEKLQYLSPIQLETLVFLIMYEKGYNPSCYRGGTGKDYDMSLPDECGNEEKLKDIQYISVKLNCPESHTKNIAILTIFGIGRGKTPERCCDINYFYKSLEDQKREKIDKWLSSQINLIPFVKWIATLRSQ